MKPRIDYTLYLVTDRGLMSTNTLEEATEQAILGGVTLVQLREKDASSLDFYNLAITIKKVTDKYNVPLIINDRVDIALAVNADGVHIGQSDLQADVVRGIIGYKKIVGVSASTVEKAVKAEKDGADYIGVGAVFQTQTKDVTNSVSIELLKEIRKSVVIPMVAIGGIKLENISRFKGTDIDGISVVSGIISSADIKTSASEFKRMFIENVRI